MRSCKRNFVNMETYLAEVKANEKPPQCKKQCENYAELTLASENCKLTLRSSAKENRIKLDLKSKKEPAEN